MDMRAPAPGGEPGTTRRTDRAADVREALRRWVDALPAATSAAAGYHFGWLDEEGAPVDRPGGKQLRPLLVRACAEAVGGDPADAAEAAVAVELVHAATLLHDDIIDGDRLRHHRPTAWDVFGVPRAMLTGDALLAQAFRVLAARPSAHAARSVAVLADAVTRMAEGEAMDVAFESRADVSPAEYAAMAEAKSGALASAACELGALAGGGDERAARALAAFGLRLGLAGQITDDLLGLFGDPEATGKPIGSDLLSAKKSHPVVCALASGTAAGERLRALLAGGAAREDLREATRLVAEAGGREQSARAAAEHTGHAVAALAGAGLRADAADRMARIADFVLHRTV
ncbi:polyprenyl synthetase family protein [Streptomyces sp. NPDC047002]|uniref:polyprenyl synthetase family protein n=1 Tax=Streptomyces sp. NPDC047002 TaxID=3155475 RepID=UPI003453A941